MSMKDSIQCRCIRFIANSFACLPKHHAKLFSLFIALSLNRFFHHRMNAVSKFPGRIGTIDAFAQGC